MSLFHPDVGDVYYTFVQTTADSTWPGTALGTRPDGDTVRGALGGLDLAVRSIELHNVSIVGALANTEIFIEFIFSDSEFQCNWETYHETGGTAPSSSVPIFLGAGGGNVTVIPPYSGYWRLATTQNPRGAFLRTFRTRLWSRAAGVYTALALGGSEVRFTLHFDVV